MTRYNELSGGFYSQLGGEFGLDGLFYVLPPRDGDVEAVFCA